MTAESLVLFNTDEHGIATITLNRPRARNAINPELHQALTAAFTQARDDRTVRAVVITGAGKGFCAGADLATFAAHPGPDAPRRINPPLAAAASLAVSANADRSDALRL